VVERWQEVDRGAAVDGIDQERRERIDEASCARSPYRRLVGTREPWRTSIARRGLR
jgi:hypothetical protein